MPQMAPISWVFLYLFFISILVIFIILNYFSFVYTPKSKTPFKTQKKSIWKW